MNSFIRTIGWVLSLRCEEASELSSQSLERELRLHERLALRGHHLVCWSCRQFGKQIHFIRQSMRQANARASELMDDGPTLSEDAKTRLKNLTSR